MWFALVAAGCATGQGNGESSSSSANLRSETNKAGRFGDWKPVIRALSASGGGACNAVTQNREGNAVAVMFPAACLFPHGSASIDGGARQTVATMAREIVRVTDREFWIAARAPRNADSERLNRARAGAVVAALIAAGVAPERLAAIVGVGGGVGGGEFDDSAPQSSTSTPPPLAGTAVIEIVAAPSPTLPTLSRSGP